MERLLRMRDVEPASAKSDAHLAEEQDRLGWKLGAKGEYSASFYVALKTQFDCDPFRFM
jgi:hypothetical protein